MKIGQLLGFVVLVSTVCLAGCCGGMLPAATNNTQAPVEKGPPTVGLTPVVTAIPQAVPSREMVTSPPAKGPAEEVDPPGEAKKIIQLSVDDLADTLGVNPEEVRLLSVEKVEWPDTSLGCPESGKVYAQVITPGFLVVLEHDGERFEYHTDDIDYIVLCTPETVKGN